MASCRAGEMTSEVCGEGAGIQGAQGNRSQNGKSPDSIHYFSKRAQFNKIRNVFEKIGPPGDQNFQGTQGDPPPSKPERSPDLTHYF